MIMTNNNNDGNNVYAVMPMQNGQRTELHNSKNDITKNDGGKTKKKKKISPSSLLEKKKKKKRKKKKKSKRKKVEKEGDISQMREERRDLYDLLYGDEPVIDEGENDSVVSSYHKNQQEMIISSTNSPTAISEEDNDLLGDENLDNFDPYGLDDC